MNDGLRDMPLERLEADIEMLAADLARSLERWLGLVAEFDRRGAARGWGFRGTAQWLAWRCGISARAARDHVRVARGLTERAVMREAFASGELSYSKVRALVRAPAGEDEHDLVELARSATAGEVERMVRTLRSAPSADVDVANRAHERRYLEFWWEEDGSLSFRGRLAGDDAAGFAEAVEVAAAALHGPAPRRGTAQDLPAADSAPPLGARRADALAEIARSGAPRAQVVLHVDEPALACTASVASERAGETCELEDGPAVPSQTARRLACDADMVIARRTASGGLDYGRSRRVVPPALRTALERRDRRCRFPGCERRHDLHAHHVRHWAHGGATDKDNLVLLCRFHHRLVHEEGFAVRSVAPGTFDFARPDGRRVPPQPSARLPAGHGQRTMIASKAARVAAPAPVHVT